MDQGGKQSWKWIETPVSNIRDLLLHHSSTLKRQKNTIVKEQRVNNWHSINQEKINADRTVKQLNATLRDLNNISARVQTCDLDKFNKVTADVKKHALLVLKEYKDLESTLREAQFQIKSIEEDELKKKRELEDEEERLKQISAQMTLIKQETEHQQMIQQEMENLEGKIKDVNEIMYELGQVVHAQGESVANIEQNIEITHENVLQGESQLAKAAKHKAAIYPLVFAAVGTCVGGPIGAFAGFKLGSLAALGGTIIGYTGGKMVKDKQGDSVADTHDSPIPPDPVHV